MQFIDSFVVAVDDNDGKIRSFEKGLSSLDIEMVRLHTFVSAFENILALREGRPNIFIRTEPQAKKLGAVLLDFDLGSDDPTLTGGVLTGLLRVARSDGLLPRVALFNISNNDNHTNLSADKDLRNHDLDLIVQAIECPEKFIKEIG